MSLFLKQISKEKNPTETESDVRTREPTEYSTPSRQTKTHSKEEIRFMQRKLTQSLKRISALNHSGQAARPQRGYKTSKVGCEKKRLHRDPCLDFPLLFLIALGSTSFRSLCVGSSRTLYTAYISSGIESYKELSFLGKGVIERATTD